MKKNFAFTLAEVLIVLGIIGVVAAFTIPTLINKIQNNEFAEKFKKEYSVFNNAWAQIIQDNGGSIVGVYNSDADFINDLCGKLKCIKKCTVSSEYTKCFHSTDWYDLLGDKGWTDFSNPGAILIDGTSFSTRPFSKNCNLSGYNNTRCTNFIIDINGFAKPNTMGRDIFELNVTQKLIVPSGYNGTYSTGTCDKSKTLYPGSSCGAKILLEG